MPTEIPSLWPDVVERVDVFTPTAILKQQAALLTNRTRGILRGEVVEQDRGDGAISIVLQAFAPLLQSERRDVVLVAHQPGMPYPCTVEGALCASDTQLLGALVEVLKSPRVVSTLQSLLARSNEAQVSRA